VVPLKNDNHKEHKEHKVFSDVAAFGRKPHFETTFAALCRDAATKPFFAAFAPVSGNNSGGQCE
jgi:hypothetical protein